MKFTKEELEKIKKEKMEEIDKWLDNEYGYSYTRLEELHDFLIDRNMKYQDELDKYKNIVDELRKYLENNKVDIGIKPYSKYAIPVEDILNKLKELKERNKIDE